MFTFRPPSKNGNGHTNSNGNGNGHSNGHTNGNGHANGNGHGNGNGNGHGQSLTSVLFGNGHKTPPARNGHSHKVDSVLGPGLHLKGELTGNGGIRIEGTFDGIIKVNGPVVIAEGGKVTADITASAVTVGGSLQGTITAGKVTIQSTGRVWGDLITAAFATEEGAYLRGQVRMEDEPLAVLPPSIEEAQAETPPI